MTAANKTKLQIVDYQASLQLLCHEDQRKSHLFNLFFLINGALLAFYYRIFNQSENIASIITVVALIFSVVWYFIIQRMEDFISLRYAQMKAIEKDIGTLTSITNELMLREDRSVIIYGAKFSLKSAKFFSVTKIEKVLPIIVSIFWVILLVLTLLGVIVTKLPSS